MTTLDLRKQYQHLYRPSAKAPAVVEVPELSFLMVDGQGDPNHNPEFAAAVEALYGASYTLKFAAKLGPLQVDYPVMPLEGLWWSEPPLPDLAAYLTADRRGWRWTVMIMQPEFTTADMVAEAVEKVRKKKDSPALGKLRLERLHEGMAVQIMHIGPYSEELPNLQRLEAFAHEQGYTLHGKHHEIYLSDPRRTAPEKLKTVLRHAVVEA